MSNYHPTDSTGQAIEAARSAHVLFRSALDDLDRELSDERELHRGEVMRLVERAEAAESEAERLAGVDAGLADAQARIADIARERDEERDARRDAEDRADDAERKTRLAHDHNRDIERQLIDALRRAERAEERAGELDAELRAVTSAAQGDGHYG
jgi:chromosome segregation ATPase